MGVGREGATGLYKADNTCAIKQWGLNLELLCDPMSSQKCVVESV